MISGGERDPTTHVLGLNHRTAPVSIREQFAADPLRTRDWLELAPGNAPIRESVLLSTCNRVDLHVVTPDASLITPQATELTPHAAYYHPRAEAVTHLLSVASGLDSLVLGEHEIMAQIKEALKLSLEEGRCGPTLARLFHHALRSGKRARSETAISSGLFSVGQCAARKAQAVLGELAGKRLLIFGAGRIAHVTAKHMIAAEAGPIAVYSRTKERAEALALPLGATAVDALGLMDALRDSDILVGCATAPHHLVGCAEIVEATHARNRRPLVVIDLGMPRNVDPEVGRLPGVHLFNIDHLEAVVAEDIGSREAESERVRTIVREEVATFQCYRLMLTSGFAPVEAH